MLSYKLKITLKDSKPPIDRTVLVPSDVTFEDLAHILTTIMGWSGDRPCAFRIPKERFAICSPGWETFDPVFRVDYRTASLSEFEDRHITFLYGDADEWILDIRFQKAAEDAPDHPVLKKARGGSPPEDVDGMHGYYAGFGIDSYSEGWQGYDVPFDDGYIDRVNRFFSEEWTRFPPIDERLLDPRMMKAAVTSMLDPSTEYVFDRTDYVVLPVGEGRGEVPEDEAYGDGGRYVPIVPDTPGFPYSVASHLQSDIRYHGAQGDADAYRRFVSGLKGGKKVDFDGVMLERGLRELEDWADRNRILLDHEGFLAENPEVFRDRIEDSLLEVINHFRNAGREREAEDIELLCPRCAVPCKGKVDRTQTPTSIAGQDVHPLVIVCGGCGRSTTLTYQNDGFNKGYTYPGMKHPASYTEDAVRLSAKLVGEKDPVTRMRLSADLAGAYWRTEDMDLARRTLDRADDGRSKGRRVRPDANVTLRIAALYSHLGGGSKDVRQSIRDLKRSVGSLSGPYGALFTACCCRDAKAIDERIRMYRRTLEIADSCDPGDYMALRSRYIAAVSTFAGAEDVRGEVIDELVSLTRRLADILEDGGFRSDWARLFSASYNDTMHSLSVMAMKDTGLELSSDMTDRFCSDIIEPHGGLYAAVAYSTAVFLLECGVDRDRALKFLKDIQSITATTLDNGPYSVDRTLVSAIVYDALGGEKGMAPSVSLDVATQLGPDPKGMFGLLGLYVRAQSGKRSRKAMMDDFMSAGIMVDDSVMDRMLETPFTPSMLWDVPILRPFLLDRS